MVDTLKRRDFLKATASMAAASDQMRADRPELAPGPIGPSNPDIEHHRKLRRFGWQRSEETKAWR